jgi:hypothetical protein
MSFPLLKPINFFCWVRLKPNTQPKKQKRRPTTTLKTFDNSHAIRITTKWERFSQAGR